MEADILYVSHVFENLLCPCTMYLKHDTHVNHERMCTLLSVMYRDLIFKTRQNLRFTQLDPQLHCYFHGRLQNHG